MLRGHLSKKLGGEKSLFSLISEVTDRTIDNGRLGRSSSCSKRGKETSKDDEFAIKCLSALSLDGIVLVSFFGSVDTLPRFRLLGGVGGSRSRVYGLRGGVRWSHVDRGGDKRHRGGRAREGRQVVHVVRIDVGRIQSGSFSGVMTSGGFWLCYFQTYTMIVSFYCNNMVDEVVVSSMVWLIC